MKVKKVGYSLSLSFNKGLVTSLLICPFPKDFTKNFTIPILYELF